MMTFPLGFRMRLHSLAQGDERYARYLEEINRIFDAFSKDGIITVPTETVAYIEKI